jgi:chromosome segregation ATPase
MPKPRQFVEDFSPSPHDAVEESIQVLKREIVRATDKLEEVIRQFRSLVDFDNIFYDMLQRTDLLWTKLQDMGPSCSSSLLAEIKKRTSQITHGLDDRTSALQALEDQCVKATQALQRQTGAFEALQRLKPGQKEDGESVRAIKKLVEELLEEAESKTRRSGEGRRTRSRSPESHSTSRA